MDKEELKIIKEQLETRSEEVQEIMGFIPSWIIRWGITVVFAVILILLIGSWFFKYPEILTSTIVVTTKTPPASIVSKSTGKFEKIFFEDGERVKKGALLAVIENPCNYKNFIELKEILKSINWLSRDQSNFTYIINININKSLKLGELQAQYELFIKAYQDYLYLINNKSLEDELESIKRQLNKIRLLIKQSTEQKSIQKKELDLFKKKYNRAEVLIADGIISKEKFDSSNGIYLQKEYGYKGAEIKITNLELRIEELNRNVISIKSKFKEDKEQLSLNLMKIYKSLIAEISIWEQKYLLKSSINGIIVFTKYWNINQNVKIGDRVLTIIPESKEMLLGRVFLSAVGSGKVRLGQNVNIKFDGYPFMEYGMVIGIIKKRSRIPLEDKYILEVGFPNGLITNYKKELKFNQEMKGIVEIITEDISLFERIFLKLKALIKN